MCAVLLTLFATSCKKDAISNEVLKPTESKHSSNGQVSSRSDADDELYNQKLEQQNKTKDFKPIVLGEEIKNPYTLENMTQAYLNVYGHNPKNPLPVTHKYVKLIPKFKVLEEQLVADNTILVQTYPISRKVAEPGQYYIPPGKTAEDVREFYASVPANYVAPKNVTMTLIEDMFIPHIAAELEAEAFLLSDNLPDDHDYAINRDERIREVRENPCRNFPSEIRRGDYEPCEAIGNPSCSGTGRLRVQNMGVATVGSAKLDPVMEVEMKISNAWKYETHGTGTYGFFSVYNSYTIGARVEAYYTSVFCKLIPRRNIIGLNTDPVVKDFGWFKKSSLCDLDLIIPSPAPNKLGTNECLYYTGAITNNAVHQHRKYANDELGAGVPYLKIVMTDNFGPHHAGTLMLNDLLTNQSANSVTINIAAAQIQIPISLASSSNLLKIWAYDIAFGYGDDGDKSGVNPNVQPAYYFNFFNTDRYDEMVFHELCHMLHYTRVTPTLWTNFGLAEFTNPDKTNFPGATYGPCCTKLSPIIAVGEAWAYHMGHYLADKKWNGLSTVFPEQGDIDNNFNILAFANSSNNAISSHQNFLENYNPTRAADPNAWLPKGLLNDLIDETNETQPVLDEVSGFTNKDFFNTLSGSTSPQQWRNKLIGIPGHIQQSKQITKLFFDYGF
jgi:hypothetical protein